MFCDSESEEASVHRMVVVATVVSLLPLVAFLYPLIVYGVYASMHEIHWTDAKSLKSIFLRFILLAISVLASCGIVALCGACGETIPDQQTWWCLVGATALVGTIVGVVSVKLMVATRRKDVVGVDEVPFYGSKALAGKFMVVTGANNGIGFETTRQLAAQGATIALLCRNPKRATKAIEDIINLQEQLHAKDPILYPTPSISKDQLIFVPVDLTDFESIRQAAKAVEQLLKQKETSFVDALICNAGLMMGTQSTTKDGLETMMQANHLGHFLLTKLMLEKGMLKTSTKDGDEPSRVAILTSSTYLFAASTTGFDFVDPYCSTGERDYTLFGQYSMTKLANLLTSMELARRYNTGGAKETESSLAVFAVHPGIVRTNVTSNMPWWLQMGNAAFAWIVAAIQKTPAEGAYSTVYTMAAPLSKIPFWKKGSYIVNCEEKATNDYVSGPRGSLDSTRLWEWSENELALQENGSKNAGEKKEQ